MRSLLILLIFAVIGHVCNAEIFTAMAAMKTALLIQKKFASQLLLSVPQIVNRTYSEKIGRYIYVFDIH